MQSGDPTRGSNFQQNFKAQVITKRMLVQRLAAVLGYVDQGVDEGRSYPLPASSFSHFRIKRLRDGTTGWPRTFNAIREHLQTFQGLGDTFFPSPATQSSSSTNGFSYRAVSMLVGARRNLRHSDYLSAAGNMQLTAFMLLWHCSVSFSGIGRTAKS